MRSHSICCAESQLEVEYLLRICLDRNHGGRAIIGASNELGHVDDLTGHRLGLVAATQQLDDVRGSTRMSQA